jgi:transposase-like protein
MNNSTKTAPAALAEAASGPPAAQAKRYDEAFKRQSVEHWIKTGKPGTPIASELGLSDPRLTDWKRRDYGDATPQREDVAAEIRALKGGLAPVREPRDILKKLCPSSPNRPGTLPNHPTPEDQTLPGPALRRPRGEAFRLPRLGPGRPQRAGPCRRGPAAEDPRGVCRVPRPRAWRSNTGVRPRECGPTAIGAGNTPVPNTGPCWRRPG